MRAVTSIGGRCRHRAIAGNIRRESESQVAKFDFTGERGIGSDGSVAVVDLRLSPQNIIEPAHGGGAALENISHPAESNHGPDEQAEIAIERDQRAKRDLAPKKLVTTLPEHNEERKADQGLERRHKHAPSANELDVSGHIFAVRLVEPPDFRLFLRVGANDTHAGKIFLHFG